MLRSGFVLNAGLRQPALMLALVLALAPLSVAAASAEGGVVAALEGAPLVAIGRVASITRLAYSGFLAELEIERSLRGDTPIGNTDPALGVARILVAWEEPAPSLPPRFTEDRRVLIAVVPLPTASIWRLRIPDDQKRTNLLAIAGDGEGYLLRPAAAELDVIEHYLALDDEARRGDAGVFLLSRLCLVGQSRLATDAAQRLRNGEAFANHVTPAAANAILDALLRSDEKEVRSLLLEAIRAHRPGALRPLLEARIREQGSDAPAILFSTRAALDGGLDQKTIEVLLASPDPAAREEAARQAGGEGASAMLFELIRRDDAPRVRAAAIRRLARLDGLAALSDLMSALEDPDARVRFAAAEAVAGLGPGAVDRLRERALRDRSPGAQTAVATLSLMGPEAVVALLEIAKEHPDGGMRTIAQVALGRPVGDSH